MRRFAFCTFLALHGWPAAADTGPAATPGKPPCTLQSPTWDSKEVTCPIAASGAAQRYRLKVNFSGGHDDTMASMAPTLNGAALACEPGSKTRLFGEDGDVSLVCLFTVAGDAAAGQALKARFTWSHAQYTDFEFSAH